MIVPIFFLCAKRRKRLSEDFYSKQPSSVNYGIPRNSNSLRSHAAVVLPTGVSFYYGWHEFIILLTKQVHELLLFATGVSIGFVAGFVINQIIERRVIGSFPDEAPARRRRRPVEHDEQQEEKLSFPVQESGEEREAMSLYP